jgi:hypothetical protein
MAVAERSKNFPEVDRGVVRIEFVPTKMLSAQVELPDRLLAIVPLDWS